MIILVLQGKIPFRTAQSKHLLELPARQILGSRWATPGLHSKISA